MNPNFEFLNTYTDIDRSSFEKLKKISQYKVLKKNEAIVKEGELPTTGICMLISGIMRAYMNAETGKQHNKKIFAPRSFVGGLTAIITNTPSRLTYEALTKCEIFEIDFKAFLNLCKKDIKIANLYNKILENIFMEYEERSLELMSMDATERYLKLRERIPHIDDLIPQFQIASFLGITPVQLSRIRKNLN